MRSGLQEHGDQACLAHLLAHTIAIVNGIRMEGTSRLTGKRGDSEQPGTGTPIKSGNRCLILTAGHVFEGATARDLRFLTFANQGLHFKSPREITRLDAVDAQPLTDTNAEIHHCKWEDLAVVTVHPEEFPFLDYIEVSANSAEPSEGEMLNFCGFPSDHSKIIEKRISGDREEVGIALFPTIFSGKVLPTPPAEDIKFKYDDFDPQRHFLVPYEIPHMSSHPRGFSGAAAWWESDEKQTIWRPNFKFAGTCTHSNREGTVLRIVRAPLILKFLSEIFPSKQVHTRMKSAMPEQVWKECKKCHKTNISPLHARCPDCRGPLTEKATLYAKSKGALRKKRGYKRSSK